MDKRIVVAGSREYNNYKEVKEYIDFCIRNIRKEHTLIFVSGGCRGVDLLGERYAAENSFKIERYPAEWVKYGKCAGPKRNKKWQKSATILFAFGTKKAKAPKQ